jgi:hypothetical protein
MGVALGSKPSLRVIKAEAKASQEAAVKLVAEIGKYFATGKDINELIFVPLTIMLRIIRNHEATVLLLKQKYYSEAAVLTLTQFELRHDLLYVASNIQHATQWVEHENPKHLNTNIRAKLQALFKETDADRLYETFGYLSGIKHGNPVYSELAFPGRGRGSRYVMSTGPIDDRFARTFSEALFAYGVYQLTWAAQVVNKLVAQYAIVDLEIRKQVHGHYMAQKHLETLFRRFLKRKVSSRRTFFGIKARSGAGKLKSRHTSVGKRPKDMR